MAMLTWLQNILRQLRARIEQARREAKAAAAQKQREKEAAAQREREKRQEQIQWQKNVLNILAEGKMPQMRFVVNNRPPPFKFQKSEHPIWMFSDVEYLEQRTRREIVGRSAGSSVRIARGLWVRVGQSRGTPMEYDETISRGTGLFAITSKHVYFYGERSFRIAFGKIVSVTQLEDGVRITRDRLSGHPEFFVTGKEDAEFAYQLMHAVPSLKAARETELTPVADYHLAPQHDSEILEGA